MQLKSKKALENIKSYTKDVAKEFSRTGMSTSGNGEVSDSETISTKATTEIESNCVSSS